MHAPSPRCMHDVVMSRSTQPSRKQGLPRCPPNMRILVLGASGKSCCSSLPCFSLTAFRDYGAGASGLAFIQEVVAHNDLELVLYVRSPSKIPDEFTSSSKVKVVTGQLNDSKALSDALEGVDAVVSFLVRMLIRL